MVINILNIQYTRQKLWSLRAVVPIGMQFTRGHTSVAESGPLCELPWGWEVVSTIVVWHVPFEQTLLSYAHVKMWDCMKFGDGCTCNDMMCCLDQPLHESVGLWDWDQGKGHCGPPVLSWLGQSCVGLRILGGSGCGGGGLLGLNTCFFLGNIYIFFAQFVFYCKFLCLVSFPSPLQ